MDDTELAELDFRRGVRDGGEGDRDISRLVAALRGERVRASQLADALQEFTDMVGPWLRARVAMGDAPEMFDAAVVAARSALAAPVVSSTQPEGNDGAVVEAEHLLTWLVSMVREQRERIGDVPDVRILQAGAQAWIDRWGPHAAAESVSSRAAKETP